MKRTMAMLILIVLGFLFCWLVLDGVAKQQQSASTHYVGMFPANMPEITNLITASKNSLVIVTDFCAYGQFSDPYAYNRYKQAITDLTRRSDPPDIHIYTYTPEQAQKSINDQFQNWDERWNTPGFQERVANYLKARGKFHPDTSATQVWATSSKERDKLIEALAEDEQNCDLKNVRGIEVRRNLDGPLPVLFWLRDNQEAIFSIYNHAPSSPW